jgi:protocatechuate 3,4-dioxygenase beta subunit
MTRKELKEIIRKTLQESTTLTKDTIQKKYSEMFGKNPQTTVADVAKALNTTEQTITRALMDFSLPMEETTIDVSGDPTKLTPQQKQQAINKARQTTRKPKLGTAEDPIDFI